MKKFLIGLLAVIGFLALLCAAGMTALFFVAASAKPRVPDAAVLEIRVSGEYVETKPADLWAQVFLDETKLFSDLIGGLAKAREDDRIVGLLVEFDNSDLGIAKTQELRDAVRKFRDTGKWAYAYAETFGEFAPGTLSYYAATAFDSVFLAPPGDVNLAGLGLTTPFVRGTLDKLDIYPDMDHRGDYKSAMNTYTEKAYTAPHREMMQWLLDSLHEQLVRGVAEGRGVSEDEAGQLVDGGPYLGQEALEAGLVDELLYADQVSERVDERAGTDTRIELANYVKAAGLPYASGSQSLALIYGAGGVRRGKSGYDGLFGGLSMGSETVTEAVRRAADNDRIKGILLRVDSPGGSYVASDLIWRELMRAKEKKPIVVSMSDVAGSGGYFVALPAHKIFAEPGSITTSIGVLGGKLNMRGFYNKLGMTFDRVERGKNASIYSDLSNYTPSERERFQAALDRIYMDFTNKVAEARGMEWSAVDSVGRGRVFTGEQAKERGLVDELGGLEEAVAALKELAEIPADQSVRLELYPKPQSKWEVIMERAGGESGTLTILREHVRALQAELARVRAAAGADGVLHMPVAGVEP